MDDWFSEGALEESTVFYLALALYWTPFAVVGLTPLLGGVLLWRGCQARWAAAWWQRFLTGPNAAGAVGGGIFACYLLAHFQSYPLPAAYRVTPGFLPAPLLEIRHVPRAALWAVFVAVEFLGLSMALAWRFAGRRDEAARRVWPWLILATATLLGLPWCRYGYANDVVMRGGLPALFVLQVLLVRMFTTAGDGRRRGAIVLARAAAGRRAGQRGDRVQPPCRAHGAARIVARRPYACAGAIAGGAGAHGLRAPRV